MKNLFDFATKELSQDAFLRWLFENYNCEDEELKDASRGLLLSFLNEEKYKKDNIVELWTKAQDHKADITVWLKMNDGSTFGIIIEDKTYSNEHNQLVGYKKIFDNDNWWNEHANKMKYIFYKTGFIQDWEIKTIKEANWNEFSFDTIYNFWKEYKNSKNLILNNYSNHIVDLYEKRTSVEKPTCDDLDVIKWNSYFERTIKPVFNDYICWTGTDYHGYAYICFQAKCFQFDGAPYLEIRSRDCNNDKFQSRILTYGLDDHSRNNLDDSDCENIRSKIRNYLCNNKNDIIFKGNYGKTKNKQLGISSVSDDIN